MVKVFNLHSTMYLLKPSSVVGTSIFSTRFTFHYVSIKTYPFTKITLSNQHLHSTMYLLKLHAIIVVHKPFTFTFHYVSIKTALLSFAFSVRFIFTFHYVSIKTCRNGRHFFRYVIYIPLCIY